MGTTDADRGRAMSAGSERAARVDVAGAPDGTPFGTELDHAIRDFAAAAMRADALDPVVTELVRLRCAGYHDCRLCGSLRLDAAREGGVDEALALRVRGGGVPEGDRRAAAALRFAGALIEDPVGFSAADAAELHACFSGAEIAELALDVVKWSKQKAMVALGLEEPAWDGTATLAFDASGAAVIGRSVPAHGSAVNRTVGGSRAESGTLPPDDKQPTAR